METIMMSSKEISRLEVMQKLEEKRLSQKEASAILGVSVRQIQTDRPPYALRNTCVMVCVNTQQQVTILYKGKSLPYQIYHQQTRQSEVVMSKDVDAEIKERMPFKPALDHPWRKFSLFKNRANAPAPRGVSTLG